MRGRDGGSPSALLDMLGSGGDGIGVKDGVTASKLSLFSDSNPYRRKPSISASPNPLPPNGFVNGKRQQQQNEGALSKPRDARIDDDDDAQRAAGSKADKKKRKQIQNPKVEDERMKKKRSKKEDKNNSPHKALKEAKRSNKQSKSAAASLLQQNEEELDKTSVKKKRVFEFEEEAKEMYGLKRMKKEASGAAVKTMAPKPKEGKDLSTTDGRCLEGLGLKTEIESIEDHCQRGRRSSDIPGKVVGDRNIDSGKAGRSSRTRKDLVKVNVKQGVAKEREENEVEDAEHLKASDFDEEKLRRTIFVGNLPLHLKKKALIKEFSQYGAVESARLRSVPLVNTKLPRKAAVITGHLNEARNSVNAYIVFKEHEATKAALSHNMKELHEQHIRVDFAQAPHTSAKDSSVNYDPTRSIFIGNLPFDAEDEELYQLFGSSENPDIQVEAVRIVRDRQTSIGKGFAFVLFKSKAGVNSALSRGTLNLRERDLRLRRISASKQKRIRAVGRSGMPIGKIGHGSKGKKQRLDQRSRRPFQERVGKSLSRSVQSYEGSRSSLKEGKPARWTPNSQRHANDSGDYRSAKRHHTPDGLRRVDGKKKRPAVAARKNLALKKPNAGSKNKSAKAGGAGKRE